MDRRLHLPLRVPHRKPYGRPRTWQLAARPIVALWLALTSAHLSTDGARVEAKPAAKATGKLARDAGKSKAARPTKTDPTAALREQVLQALAQQNLAAAKQALDAGYRKTPGPDLLLLMGRLAGIEGRTLDAYDLMRRYLADPARPADEAAAREAEQVVAQTPPPASEVRVQGDAGGTVVIDDRVVGVLPLPAPLLLSLGQHALVLEYPDKKLDTPVLAQRGRITEVRSNRTTGAMLLSQLPAVLVTLDAPQLSDDLSRRFWAIADEAAQEEQVTVLRPEVALAAAPDLKSCVQQIKCGRQLAAKNQTDFLLAVRVTMTGPAATATSTAATGGAASTSPAVGIAQTAAAPMPSTPPAASAAAQSAGPAAAGTVTASGPPPVPTGVGLTLLHHQIEVPAAPTVSLDFLAPDAWPKALKSSLSGLFSSGLARAHAHVTIAADPRGSEVLLGDVPIGRAPIEREMWAGSYTLQARQPGFRSEQRTVEIRGGQAERIEFDLAPLSFDRPAPKYVWQAQSRPRWRVIAGATVGAAGLVLLGFGVSALAVNGSCSDGDRIPMTGECRYVLQTTTPGAALVAVGATVALAGGVLWAVPAGRKRVQIVEDAPEQAPSPSGSSGGSSSAPSETAPGTASGAAPGSASGASSSAASRPASSTTSQ